MSDANPPAAAEPPKPTHEEAREMIERGVLIRTEQAPMLAYIAAAQAKDARIAELEREVAGLRDRLQRAELMETPFK